MPALSAAGGPVGSMAVLRIRARATAMNDTLKAIVQVLESGKPELQVAAAQILGELHARDASIVTALADAMRRSPVLELRVGGGR